MFSMMIEEHSRTLTTAENQAQPQNTPKPKNGALNSNHNEARVDSKSSKANWWLEDWKRFMGTAGRPQNKRKQGQIKETPRNHQRSIISSRTAELQRLNTEVLCANAELPCSGTELPRSLFSAAWANKEAAKTRSNELRLSSKFVEIFLRNFRN